VRLPDHLLEVLARGEVDVNVEEVLDTVAMIGG
jgi:hypothetical protein